MTDLVFFCYVLSDEVETNRKIGLLRGIRLTFGFRPFLYLFLLNLFSWLTIQVRRS